jgi:hypothetical protein
MAGGMNRRGSRRSMSERVHPQPEAQAEPPPIRHCWVTDRHGRLPALLLEWRQRADGWHGRVVRPVREEDGWKIVEDWLPAGLLEPA